MRRCTLDISEADQAQLRDVIHHGCARGQLNTTGAGQRHSGSGSPDLGREGSAARGIYR